MIKIKHIIIAAIVSVVMYSCSDNANVPIIFDHEGQAVIDQTLLEDYFKNHYFDTSLDSVRLIIDGGLSLFDDPNLKSKDVVEDDINYKVYYYVIEEGAPFPVKGNPTIMDSVLTTYKGKYIESAKVEVHFETQTKATWLNLASTIGGWTHTFPYFKGGENITDNGPITYKNVGKGVIFMPSGLGYRNSPTASIPGSSPLMFYINLLDVKENVDHDGDGLASILEIEDASVESDPRKVDTDGDFIVNFLDVDDDNDGVLTINEDTNGDGDPRNDFSDPNNPTLPDYLNPDIK
jgi:hypothetical protein